MEGTKDEAIALARTDHRQVTVTAVTAWKGNPKYRRSIFLKLHFGNDTRWKPIDKDINTIPVVVAYTRQHRPIEHVTLLKAEADKLHRAAIKPLNGLVPGQTIYVILRSYYDYDSAGPNDQPGFDSDSLVIPNKHEVTHVVKTKVTIAETAKTNTNLEDSFGAKGKVNLSRLEAFLAVIMACVHSYVF